MKFKKHPFSPWMFPSLKIKDAYLHAAGHVKTQRKTQSGGENETIILSAALWTFRRVGHGVGQAGFHRFSRSAFPKMVYTFIGKFLPG